MTASAEDALRDIRGEAPHRCREFDFLAQRPSFLAAKANGDAPKAGGDAPETNGDAVRESLDRLELQPLPPVPERVELRDLLKHYDRPFVEFAYRCFLKRPMDAGGEWHVERLREGASRIDALWRIRYGPEGKSRDVPFRGLDLYRATLRLARIPVLGRLFMGVGYVFRMLRLLAALPRAEQEQRQWRHYVMSLFTKIEEHTNESQRRLDAALASLMDQAWIADLKTELQRKLAAIAAAVEDNSRRSGEDVQRLNAELDAANAELQRKLAAIAAAVEDNSRRNEEDVQRLQAELGAAKSAAADVLARMGSVGRRLDELEPMRLCIDRLGDRIAQIEPVRTSLEELARRLDEADQQSHAIRDDLRGRLQGLASIPVDLDALRRRLDRIAGEAIDGDDFYAKFAEQFRGSMEDISGRLEFYISFIEASGAGAPEAPVLDLGCGRGEWLALLRNHGKAARGIDCNEVFLERCRQADLSVDRGEAIEHLESLAPASLGAITGFHIIEHLSGGQQIRLAQLAFRALRPGGALILETPNPEHLGVAALRFHLDPTHVRPIPPPLLEFIAKHAGFADVRIERRAPCGDYEAAQGWSRFQDYAIIALRASDA